MRRGRGPGDEPTSPTSRRGYAGRDRRSPGSLRPDNAMTEPESLDILSLAEGGADAAVASRGGSALELSGAALRELVEAALDRIVPHLESLPDQPAADTDAAG